VELFQSARKLMDAGDYEHACPKFAEAQRLLPTPGTMLSIGLCHEKAGKLASAYGAYKEAEVFARSASADGHQAEAQQRAAALALKVAKLAIVVPPAAKVQGFELRRDGSVVGEAQWGSPMPADIGWHKVEATAPGKKAWATTVRIETDGSSASVNVPVLEDQAGGDAATYWNARRVAGVTAGGVGVAGLVLGAAFGGVAISKNNASKADCDPKDPRLCSQAGADARHAAGRLADASTAMLIAGGVAAAAGLTVFLTAPKGDDAKKTGRRVEVMPLIGAGTAGLGLRGEW
jgi:hypothetical protein